MILKHLRQPDGRPVEVEAPPALEERLKDVQELGRQAALRLKSKGL